ncbi:MAG: NADH-quinone oxidoreductase subunit L [Gammaproteobacteria bacterium]|nr:NADH-quinone oxidoreductase subunit L [Pseudomonadales bacterium]MCP5347397.1 NADH-quinone oxidoreductase subunit L [Pseudomonadales bacterium]
MNFQQLLSGLPLLLPLLYLIAAFCNRRVARWQLGFLLSLGGFFTALIAAFAGPGIVVDRLPATLVSPVPVSYLLALLVGFLGLIVGRFSRNYLAGDAHEARFATLLYATLAAVALVVTTDHLLVLLGAWMGVSIALNELLLFYPERPRAIVAAHKKFLFARTAELTLLAASLLLHAQHGTWQISTIVNAYPAQLSGREQLAAILLAVTALIKCAQLPAHGWLIQVVEAPTPVSALLHAGIINLGGYLLILFAPLLSSSSPAEWLLLVVAGLTTVLASLIMLTRVTIKVKLAWSTTAQMGLMLVECALGLYELALLHLLAHSCYKAYLFLRSGTAVHSHLDRRLTSGTGISTQKWLLCGSVATAVSLLAWQALFPDSPLSPWILMAAMLTLLLGSTSTWNSGTTLFSLTGLGLLLLSSYLVQKSLLLKLVGDSGVAAAGWQADLWVISLIMVMCLVFAILRMRPASALSKHLRIWLFAGLYLDEWVTRTTLRLWPVQMPLQNERMIPGTQFVEAD